MNVARVLVTGAAGQLGDAVVRAFADWDVVAPARKALDITDPGAVTTAVRAASPTLIVNCAAFNDVDAAEERQDEALATNAFAVRALARAADACGAALVHFGTDFVFDGEATAPYTEEATPSPRSAYASSKLLGEWFALEAARGFVLRVESLFGKPPGWSGRLGTLDRMVRAMLDGREVSAFTDRVVTPTYVEDAAAATRALIDRGAAPGLYHCVNSGPASWYNVVEASAAALGVAARIKPVTLDQVTLKAVRPRYCALSNVKLHDAGFAMPEWQDALGRWLAAFRQGKGQE